MTVTQAVEMYIIPILIRKQVNMEDVLSLQGNKNKGLSLIKTCSTLRLGHYFRLCSFINYYYPYSGTVH